MEKRGSIEVICGCIYSGKTEELIRRVRRELIVSRAVQVFIPLVGKHHSLDKIQSHNEESFISAIPVSDSSDIEKILEKSVDVVAIDDVQFFDNGIIRVCEQLADSGIRVIVAGLELDFRGEPFPGPILALLAKADILDKLTAVCVKCGRPAVRSQRLIDGKPAEWDSAPRTVAVRDTYVAVCRLHHQIEKPKTNE